MSYQGAAMAYNRGSLVFFMTEVNALMIIWVKYEDKIGHYCIIPRGKYGPKGLIPYIFLMDKVNAYIIIWVNDGEQLGRDCVIPRGRYAPKEGIPWFCSFLWLIHV